MYLIVPHVCLSVSQGMTELPGLLGAIQHALDFDAWRAGHREAAKLLCE